MTTKHVTCPNMVRTCYDYNHPRVGDCFLHSPTNCVYVCCVSDGEKGLQYCLVDINDGDSYGATYPILSRDIFYGHCNLFHPISELKMIVTLVGTMRTIGV